MEASQVRNLGRVLRERREQLGLSLRVLAGRSSVPNNTILQIEQGKIASPSPDKLARMAAALDLSLADVYAIAGYTVPSELPNFRPYLRTKYADLPPEDLDAIERYATDLAKRHGISLAGPTNGEDEARPTNRSNQLTERRET